MKPKVLLFAKRFGLVEKLKSRGYEVILVDESPHPLADHFIQLTEFKAAFEMASIPMEQFKIQGEVVAVIPNGDLYVELVAKVREAFYPSCIGLSPTIAGLVRDKLNAKAATKEAGIPTCKFSAVFQKTYEELSDLLRTPFLIKPRKLILAQGIVLIEDKNQFISWQEKNSQNIDLFYAEEFITIEKELSCDSIVSNGEVIAQFPCEYTVPCLKSSQTHEGFGAMFPANLSSEDTQTLKSMAKNLIKLFGIKDGFCHLEFLKSKRGILYGEINPRLPGGQHIAAESLVMGKDVRDIFLDVYLHRKPSGFASRGSGYYGYYLFPNKPGRIEKISNQLGSTPWVLEHSIIVKEGDVTQWLDSSVASSGFAMFGGQSVPDLQDKMKTVPTLVRITTRA